MSSSEEKRREGRIPAMPIQCLRGEKTLAEVRRHALKGRQKINRKERKKREGHWAKGERMLESGERQFCTRPALGNSEMREIDKPLRVCLNQWTRAEICWVI